MEINIGGYFHAATTLLAKLDHAQNRFLHELGLSPEHAFLEYNFAPPRLRRNIAALGLFQKRVLGKCHPSFDRLMPWYSDRFPDGDRPGHDKSIYTHWTEICAHNALFYRSILAMADVYNNFPQHVVDIGDVNSFQSYLTQIARARCEQGDAAWASSFCRRAWGQSTLYFRYLSCCGSA